MRYSRAYMKPTEGFAELYGGALPSAWGAIVEFAFPLPRVGIFVGATSSGDVGDSLSESMS